MEGTRLALYWGFNFDQDQETKSAILGVAQRTYRIGV